MGVRKNGSRTEPPRAVGSPLLLLVETTRWLARHLKREIEAKTDYEVRLAANWSEAERALQSHCFAALITGRFMPDAADNSVIDLGLSLSVPTFVLTSGEHERVQAVLGKLSIIDYFFKDMQCVDAICSALCRLRRNPDVKLLVIDDSRSARETLAHVLGNAQYQVLTAGDGIEGLEVLEEHPEIKLVIVDFEMPRMGGFEFVERARARRFRDSLAIIGVSANHSVELSTRFLKVGANDFLTKPFSFAELKCRVNNNVALIERIEEIQRLAFRDLLTDLPNRLHFFRTVPALYADRPHKAVAMLDIDHFKRVNDTYGHAGGDVTLKQVAQIIARRMEGKGVAARFGGEEFCLFFEDARGGTLAETLEGIRAEVQSEEIWYEGQRIEITISIGATRRDYSSLDAMINGADQRLYAAKTGGRNQVITEAAPTAARAKTLVSQALKRQGQPPQPPAKSATRAKTLVARALEAHAQPPQPPPKSATRAKTLVARALERRREMSNEKATQQGTNGTQIVPESARQPKLKSGVAS